MDDNPTILIVDDDLENLTYLEEILKQLYKTRTAITGEDAIAITQESPPDLILLDIKLPNMDGYEVCREIKANEQFSEIPILFLSAYDDVEDKLRGFEAGGVDYLTKPFYPAEVLARVKTHLGLRQIQQQLQAQNRQLEAEVIRRQKAENDLRKSEEKYRLLFEKTNDAVFIYGLNGNVIDGNQQGADLIGYTIEEMIGRPVTDFIVPDEYPAWYQQSARLQAGEILSVYERNVRKKNGEILPTEIKLSLIHNDDGEPLYMHSVVRDISERKALQEALEESEQRYKNILENASEAVFSTDHMGFFNYVNTVMVRRSGYSEEELLGKHFTELIDRSWQERVVKFYQKQFLERIPETVLAFPLMPNQGEQIWVEQTTNLLFTEGRIDGFLGITRDITKRKKVEAERERLIDELDAFAHTVAHDLKAPLGTLRLSSEMLQMMFDTLSEEKRQARLVAIQQNADKMAAIIDALLLLARVRQYEDIPITELDMKQIISNTIERLKSQIQSSNAQITIADSFPLAYGYRLWVEEVWANYILNALTYGGKPPHIELGANILADNSVRFWVKDNGKGLSEEEQEQVFIPFTRLQRINDEGHGLGLSIVQRIIDKLNGTVGVESSVGEGSTFYFTLPSSYN